MSQKRHTHVSIRSYFLSLLFFFLLPDYLLLLITCCSRFSFSVAFRASVIPCAESCSCNDCRTCLPSPQPDIHVNTTTPTLGNLVQPLFSLFLLLSLLPPLCLNSYLPLSSFLYHIFLLGMFNQDWPYISVVLLITYVVGAVIGFIVLSSYVACTKINYGHVLTKALIAMGVIVAVLVVGYVAVRVFVLLLLLFGRCCGYICSYQNVQRLCRHAGHPCNCCCSVLIS